MKRARTLMVLMLVSLLSWVAIVGLVIKPPFWLGAVLAIIGGIVIGTFETWLMWRWWFRRPLADRMIDVVKEK